MSNREEINWNGHRVEVEYDHHSDDLRSKLDDHLEVTAVYYQGVDVLPILDEGEIEDALHAYLERKAREARDV